MKTKTKSISSAHEFLRYISDNREIENNELNAYRGQPKPYPKIKPKIYRSDYGHAKENEHKILSEILTYAPEEFANDRSTFEMLARAQHYGLPTRLLDVSLNPLVALFFAVNKEPDFDGEVITFRVQEERQKLFDSDAITCVANLARLNSAERTLLYEQLTDAKENGGIRKINRKKFNKQTAIKRLVHFAREEKPYFIEKVAPADLWKIFFVSPKNSNRRIISQSGGFIISGLIKSVTESASKSIKLRRIKIPKKAKHAIKIELDAVNINDRTMYPEIENVSRYLDEKYRC